MSTGTSVMQIFMKTLQTSRFSGGTLGISDAVTASSTFKSIWNWTDSFTDEFDKVGNYASTNDFLKAVFSIDLTNTDTGALIGQDAGGRSIRTAESIVPENSTVAYSYPKTTTSTFQGLTVTWPTVGYSGSSLSNAEQYIVGALNTWWINESLTLINQSFGINFNEPCASVKNMDVKFIYNPSSSALASTDYKYNPSTGKATSLSLIINMYYYNSINANDPNGSSDDASLYLDRTIAHEMTHAVMAATIADFDDMPAFVAEGLAELVQGIDDERAYTMKYLCSYPIELLSALSSSSTASDSFAYAAGYMALRYLILHAKNASTTFTSTATIYYDPARPNSLIIASSGNDEIWLDGRKNIFYDNVTTLDASTATGNLILAGDSQGNVISGGKGTSSLWGGSGDSSDILQGGSGRDTFYYGVNDGNDTIKNYNSAADIINIYSGSITNVSATDSNILLAVGSQSLTIEGAAGGNIIVGTADGQTCNAWIGKANQANSTTYQAAIGYYFGGNQSDTLVITGSAEIWLNNSHSTQYSSIDILDARTSAGTNILAGSSDSNLIMAGTGSSSLWGGSGNVSDTLQGGSGVDSFYYGGNEGNDLITNSNSLDKVVLYSPDFSYASTKLVASNLVISTTNGNTLTIQNWSENGLNTFEIANGEQYKCINTNGNFTYQQIR